MNPLFRTLMTCVGLLITAPMVAQAQSAPPAAAFPTRPITLIIPWQAGGIPDTQLRLLARLASKHLGQPIITENKPGGVGTMAPATVAANGKPDGYTITQFTTTVLRMPYLMKVTYDPLKDFTFIGGLSAFRFGVVVRADSPFKTWADFIAYAKANPGKLTYTTFGTNSVLHLTMERIAAAAGVKLRHVPSRGNSENNAAVLGGHVMASADGSSWAPFVDSGQFRLLVTWGEQRSKRWPDVPTLKEVGIDITESTPFGLVGPAGMDPKVVATLYDAFRKAMHDPEHIKLLGLYDMELFERGPDEFRKWATEENVRIKEVVERFAEKDKK
ncbi:MAG: tripartite tricarboxylate transporter substrate binding protein [Burkholderiales bacterium]|nr:tripartite tricarboxylate transporter substrate binding protein [Burkholderiales bacterium]